MTVSNSFFNLALVLVVFSITSFYKIRFNQIKIQDLEESKKFKSFMSDLISFLTEPATFISSFAVLKGLFLDHFFSAGYFALFETHEKVFLLMASAFFFISSFIELKDYCKQLFIKNAEDVNGVTNRNPE